MIIVSPFHHQEIPCTNSIYSRNGEVKIVYLFFKVTLLEVSQTFCYFIGLLFDCKRASTFAIFLLNVMAFPSCTCEPVDTQHSFEFHWVAWHRCVGLAQKISARCKSASNTGSYVFSFSFICIFILFLVLLYMYVFLLPQGIPSDLEVCYEKSILTRTKTLSIKNPCHPFLLPF